MKRLITLFILFFSAITLFAQEGYPKPTADNVIFYIQHNRGKNTFFYQPKFSKDGNLDSREPIIAQRQLFDEDGEIKPLSAIQKRYAYGVSTTKINDNTFDVRLAAYKNQRLILKLNSNQEAYIETKIDGKHMIVKRLFIYQKEGTGGLNTKVDYIMFHGMDKNGKEVQAKLFP